MSKKTKRILITLASILTILGVATVLSNFLLKQALKIEIPADTWDMDE